LRGKADAENVVHSVEAILALLRRGLIPVTDNREAIVGLGFVRAYPQVRGGYDSTIWERSVEHVREGGGARTAAMERVYLIDAIS
jgi:hypothetical protein